MLHISNSKATNIKMLAFGLVNAIVTGVIIVITLLNIIVYKLRQLLETNFDEELNIPSEQLCRHFSLYEIQLATRNFDDALVIGRGGFGKVYEGLIDNGARVVAIKRLNHLSKQGTHEFSTEIEMLSKLRHSHIISLIGYCNNFHEKILVYEYMARGTVADHLHKIGKNGNSPLHWEQRLKICIGAARGLDYLHTGTGIRERIIHRDVKSSNILLGENWDAKISDFGMSKIGPANQSFTHVSTNVKGTHGYLDPEYFLTHKLTRKSDVYAFGVVLFEALCGRPAVDLRLNEEQWGLAGWVRRCIKEGKLDQIIDPSLRGKILIDCLTAFAEIANQCLHKLPKKRPTMAEVVARLEFALTLQERKDSFLEEWEDFNNCTRVYDNQDNGNSSTKQQEVINISNGGEKQEVIDSCNGGEKHEVINSGNGGEQQEVINASNDGLHDEKFDGIKKLGDASNEQARIEPFRMTFIRKVLLFFSGTARNISNKTEQFEDLDRPKFKDLARSPFEVFPFPSEQILPTPNLRIFRFSELKAATRNFRPDTLLGEGVFGKVFKGWLDEKNGSGTSIAVKRFNSEGLHGFDEWQAEVEIHGRLSHPNLVRLLGYCLEDKELLLVYEFMKKGGLDNYLFGRGSAVVPLPWDTRLKVLIGAARGLAFLHTSEKQVIYKDFKTSNILLDGSYTAKLSDFGKATMGPPGGESHVTTTIVGTYGYAAPEYIATGHLCVKSNVYGFGVVLVETLTGLRAYDFTRPSGQNNLVDWVKPRLGDRGKLKNLMDPRLQGNYPSKAALQISQIALKCLSSKHKSRPSMEEVVETLEQVCVVNGKPKKA